MFGNLRLTVIAFVGAACQLKWWLHCKGQYTSSFAATACSQDNQFTQVVVGLMSAPLQHDGHAKLYRPQYKSVFPSLCYHLVSYLVYHKTEPCYHQLCCHASFLHTSLSRPAWCHTHILTPLSIPILLRTISVTFLENQQDIHSTYQIYM